MIFCRVFGTNIAEQRPLVYSLKYPASNLKIYSYDNTCKKQNKNGKHEIP